MTLVRVEPASAWVFRLLAVVAAFQATLSDVANALEVSVATRTESPGVELAVEELGRALKNCGDSMARSGAAPGRLSVVIDVDERAKGLKAGGFTISLKGGSAGRPPSIRVTGRDAPGAMYGTFDLAEQIAIGGGLSGVRRRSHNPRFPFRAIKFNLPWMSYRRSPALEVHAETCRDIDFWREFLDMMAANRFNVLSLWSLHPYTWMVRPKNFPEACTFSDEELAEWKSFWRELFRMARDRGIETYIVNWNIFTSPSFAEKRGVASYCKDWRYIGTGDTSELVREYTRQCVTQVIDEYEDLSGIGVSLGERMGGMTPAEREEWIVDTIVAGMLKASRKVKFIHRAPFSAGKGSGGTTSRSTEQLARGTIESLGLPNPVWVEVKFNWSHGHSSPRLCRVHGGKITDAYWNPVPADYKLTWMIRNEDFFMLRWGEAGFIREHIKRNGADYCGGYFIGSECYIPAKDYMCIPDERIEHHYGFQRQWLYYMTWGRLLYDPEAPNAVFDNAFSTRYPTADGSRLRRAYELVSRMPLRLASLHGATWDFTLYSEGFLAPAGSGGRRDKASPFISIDELIDHPVLDPRYISIRDYVRSKKDGRGIAKQTMSPIALANSLESDVSEALSLIRDVAAPPTGRGRSLHFELVDIRCWARLSMYMAEKLRGGVALEMFRQTKEAAHKAEAVRRLNEAADHWRELVELTRPVYREVPLVHLKKGKFHWSLFSDQVERDIRIARDAR